MANTDRPWKSEAIVTGDGRLQLQVPFPSGSEVVVYVMPRGDSALNELVAASESSTDFWDNPADDEDWNGD